MSDLLNRLAYLQTRRDRTPNLDLARDLVSRNDKAGIREIAETCGMKIKIFTGIAFTSCMKLAPLSQISSHNIPKIL